MGSPSTSDARQRAEEWAARLNRDGGSYHRLDLGDGLVVEGDYDIGPYLDRYGFPDDLTGKRVLDVGTASGFFALEFARRGATVTAVDLWEHHPLPTFAEALGLDVRYVSKDLYELDASFGTFDLVFFGSVLLHLWDPFNALRAVREVTAGRLILATAISSPWRWLRDRRPLVQFVGQRGDDGETDYWFTWKPNKTAVLAMLRAAGFEDPACRGSFRLASAPGRPRFSELHGVFHARAD